MISFSSFKTFLSLNIGLCIFSYIDYLFDYKADVYTGIISVLFKNYLFIDIIEYKLWNVEYIDEENRKEPKETFFKEFDLYLLSTSIIECGASLFIKKYFINYDKDDIMYDLKTFILYSFYFEVIFDFLHYTTHYISHHRLIYKYIHKTHHYYKYPNSILTFYHNPIDVILTNFIPLISTLYIMSFFSKNPSLFMYKLIMSYKTFIEISGHTGKKPNGSSFAQFFWLPKFLGIELNTKDHDLHHTLNNCNYSKRFSLWDKVFGTYKST